MITSKSIPLHFFAIILIGFLVIASGEYMYLSTINHHNSIGISGKLFIIQNGKIIRTINDAIQTVGGVDTIMCKIFNFSCSITNIISPNSEWANGGGTQIGTACSYWEGPTPTLKTGFYSESICTMQAIALSTDTTTVTTVSECPLIQTANGMAPSKATETLTTQSVNSETIQLSNTFTPTSTVTLSKVCLIAWNSHAATYSAANLGTINGNPAAFVFAMDLISPTYTTVIGTAFTVQWQITVSYA